MTAAVIAAAAEGAVVYVQWPSPPLKVCASAELGNLVARATRTDAELRYARSELRPGLGESDTKSVMRLEEASAAAWNEVASFKKRALEQQRASGAAASSACN